MLGGFIVWLGGLTVNGGVMYLWWVFGAAAMGSHGASLTVFNWITGISVVVPLLWSFMLLLKGKAAWAFACTFLMVPLVIGLGILFA
jgi:hypothetical protein